ncbi:hypothetical protein ABFX02_14G019500 [Erythranthe guttata]
MANLSHSESRRLYSWWWDSHNTPKNSKWLQENLTDMDGKVKSMIKLIEADADSFARRAEMYYKKRPELMKFVEEFYRAYRALAERYNHATGELRQAHRTISEAFPEEVPFELGDDSPSKTEPLTLEVKRRVHALFDADELLQDSDAGSKKRGLKQLHEMLRDKEALLQSSNFSDKGINGSNEVEGLKKALLDIEAEKEDVLLQYQQCLVKLCKIEGEINEAQKKSGRAEIEAQALKEALIQLEAEKNAGMVKQKEYLERISDLEAMVSKFQEDTKGLDKKAFEAESESRTLKDKMSGLELEKETVMQQYKQCLEKISDLENKISIIEDEASILKKRAERAEAEVSELKRAFANLNKEKEASALQYKCCLEIISKLEKDISSLTNKVSIGNAKLKTTEEKCALFEKSNQSLRVEADNLVKKIAAKDQELSKKQGELESLEVRLKDEHSRHEKVEATLETLQNSHSKSRDDQMALTLELKNVVRKLKETEASKNCLEEEIRQVRDENDGLSRTNSSMESMQTEIFSLREIKERLEKEVSHHIGITISLQREILNLKEEIEGLNRHYRDLVEQVEEAGLDPTCVLISIKCLHEENSKLRQLCENGRNEKAIMSKKLENIEDALLESGQFIYGEKTALVAEKASILSQLQAMTENMQSLVGRNAVLENSLSTAKIELEGLREKSKGLDEICELLKNERSYLLTERGSLVSKLENVERRLQILEKRFMGLEEKYIDLEKEKEAMHDQVEKLKLSLDEENQERTSSQILSETRLAGLENQIHLLREENTCKKKETEHELDKALKAQFEISILHKFIKDMEEKNYSLIVECQKHVEASKLAEKLISELEGESLEQQVESELLLDEIERLRLGIYQIFRGLEIAPEEKVVENEQTFLHCILESIEDMKCSLSEYEDEKQELLVENSVLLTLLEQLESKGVEIETRKIHLEQESKIMAEKLSAVEHEKNELVEINGKLKLDVSEGREEAAVLEAEFGSLRVKQADLQKAYNALQAVYSKVNQENTYLLKKFSVLKDEKYELERYNEDVILELLATANVSEVLRSFGREKVEEVKLLLADLNRQNEVNISLEKEMSVLIGKLELQKAENLALKDAVFSLEIEMDVVKECNVRMNQDVINGKESLLQTQTKLLDAETKLEAAEKSNLTLCTTMGEMKKENESLHIANKNLESEICLLHQEREENKTREQNLSNEFELWEVEASTFCFDLQVSSVNEVLLKNKVQELTGVCRILEEKDGSKSTEIDQLKRKISLMENEISGLKSQLHAYAPVVASLRDDISFIEHNALLRSKVKAADNRDTEFLAARVDLPEDQSLASLQKLQMRVKAVGKLIEESNNSKRQEPGTSENDKLKNHCLIRDKHEHSSRKTKMLMKDIPLDIVVSHSSELKRGSVRTDDHLMLEMWETADVDGKNRDQTTIGDSRRISYKLRQRDKSQYKSDPPSTDSDVEKELSVDKLELSSSSSRISTTKPNQESNGVKILERLSSDAKKLENLHVTVENLRTKLETNKKIRKAKSIDYVAVKQELRETEDAVVYLVDLNSQLVKNIEECPKDEMASPRMRETLKTWRVKVTEQAEKGSEKVDQLQVGIQKIQCMLLKVEDEKMVSKGRNKFLRSKSIILRDFVYNGRKNSGRRKKGPNCGGCFRQSTSRNENGSFS